MFEISMDLDEYEVTVEVDIESLEHTQVGYPGFKISYDVKEILLADPGKEWYRKYDEPIRREIDRYLEEKEAVAREYRAESIAEERENYESYISKRM